MPEPLPEYLSIKQAAKRAGRAVSTIWRWVGAGFLPYVEQRPSYEGKFEQRGFIVLGTDVDRCVLIAAGLLPSEGFPRQPKHMTYIKAKHQRPDFVPEPGRSRRSYRWKDGISRNPPRPNRVQKWKPKPKRVKREPRSGAEVGGGRLAGVPVRKPREGVP